MEWATKKSNGATGAVEPSTRIGRTSDAGQGEQRWKMY
jgi:hypothetical protein